MLAAAGAAVSIESVGVGRVIRVGRSSLSCGAYTVPGDPSQAAFWLVGSVIIPGSLVTVAGVDLSIERLGFLGVLRRMGATIEVEEPGNGTGSLTAYYALLHGTTVEAAEIPSLDEVPILAVAAAAAVGTTRFSDVGELRVKESDRLAGTAELVRAFGGEARVEGDDLVVEGARRPAAAGTGGCPGRPPRWPWPRPWPPPPARPSGDLTTIAGWESVATSYPGFSDDLAPLRTGSAGS